ncbi:hypothetical protein Tco_1496832 [Tanacetum coccineum]
MSKLDRFLISDGVLDDNNDLKALVLDRLWSDHNPILLHSLKTDYGTIPFKFFSSWLQRKGIDEVIKNAYEDCSNDRVGHAVFLHDKLQFIKNQLKSLHAENNMVDVSRKRDLTSKLGDLELKIDSTGASEEEKEKRIQILQQLNDIDRFESLDLAQKARLK